MSITMSTMTDEQRKSVVLGYLERLDRGEDVLTGQPLTPGPFVKAAKTIRKFRDGLLAALRLGINNGRVEGLNNHVRLVTRRAYGFHSPKASSGAPSALPS